MKKPSPAFAELAASLTAQRGRALWRSLEDLAGSPQMDRFIQAEFPSAWEAGDASRRGFLKLMGASLGLAGLSACVRQPEEEILPHIRAPEMLIPGRPRYFATALPRSGIGNGVVVESHSGRPTKIEGNELHPASLGASDVFMQAELLNLYDPDRSQSVMRRGGISSWKRFLSEGMVDIDALRTDGGRGLALLTGRVTSPTLAAQLESLTAALPHATWTQWEPINEDPRIRATRRAYGAPLALKYDFAAADVVVSLGGDPLFAEAGSVRYARDAISRRTGKDLSRWYVVESSPTCTGSIADRRIRARVADLPAYAAAIAGALGVPGFSADPARPGVAQMADDLRKAGPRGLILTGPDVDAEAQDIVLLINEQLGQMGSTVFPHAPAAVRPVDHGEDLAALVERMNAGAVKALVIFGGNPVFDAPAELAFADALKKVPLRVHMSTQDDETSRLCHWHLPAHHPLESWSDLKAYDGTTSIVQPLVAPLYATHSIHDIVARVAGTPGRRDYDIIREHYQTAWGDSFDQRWARALHDGLIVGSAHPSVMPGRQQQPQAPKAPPAGLEITFCADPTIWDGHFANNGWMQELPKPITKLTWDNALRVSPQTAKALGVATGDLLEVTTDGRKAMAPALVVPGQADDSVSLSLGYGRTRGGRIANGVGVDAYALRGLRHQSATLTPTGQRHELVTTQDHQSMEGRNLVRTATVAEYAATPRFAKIPDDKILKLSLYPDEFSKEGEQWGMTINLNACTGCNACVIACQSENNIAVVGKDQVALGREMQWIRIDRYFEGPPDDPQVHHQPVTCMHCENAPCEVVCPVNATVHSESGINQMVYNRCVGTRYCANNCPYKVRRFNFLLYQDWDTPSLEPMRNPDVSVRSRGVMEKCTFCVQRIQQVKITAGKERRDIADGEVVTACQGACPSQAITFGDVSDPKSKVSETKRDPRDYVLLAELNTKPRTSYTAKITNPPTEKKK